MEEPMAVAGGATPVVFALFLLSLSSIVGVVESATKVPAVFVFGDSMSDVGNNNQLRVGKMTTANYPHNGVDYPGGKPTGRFCNGYVAVDFLSKMMGFEESPPAYFSMAADVPLVGFRGVNFASGGSGVFDQTGKFRSFSMNTQIGFFEGVAEKLARSKGDAAVAKAILSKSIFTFTTVSNDMFMYMRTTGRNTTMADKQLFVRSASLRFSDQITRLYKLGARKFAVFGTGEIGCTPLLRSLSPSGECLQDQNDLSVLFNVAMKKKLQDLSSNSPGMKYSYVNTYDIGKEVYSHPWRYGFKVTRQACCGSGQYNAGMLCVRNSSYCANRDEYASWDYVHPTQAAYKLLADIAYRGPPAYAVPFNIGKLVEA